MRLCAHPYTHSYKKNHIFKRCESFALLLSITQCVKGGNTAQFSNFSLQKYMSKKDLEIYPILKLRTLHDRLS